MVGFHDLDGVGIAPVSKKKMLLSGLIFSFTYFSSVMIVLHQSSSGFPLNVSNSLLAISCTSSHQLPHVSEKLGLGVGHPFEYMDIVIEESIRFLYGF